jgi:tripartite motif-containing protein 71
VSNQVQKFTNNGTFITSWSSRGSGDGQFISPAGIAVDSSNNVYVTDMYSQYNKQEAVK